MGERNNPLMKKLDRWIGCPLLFVLGLFHKKRSVKDIKKITNPQIAIIKTAGIGDTIVLSAIVDEIKSEYPDSSITWICAANNLGMVNALKDKGIDEVFCFEMKSPIRALKGIKALGHFDYVLDFAPWARINAVISWALSGKFKAGFKRKNMYRHYVYDAWAEHLDAQHEMDNYRAVLQLSGFVLKKLNPDLRKNEPAVIKGNYAVLQMQAGGASTKMRQWGNENWAELAKILYKQYGYRILFSGSSDDLDYVNEVIDKLKNDSILVENIAGKYTLAQMANVLQYAKLVVSVNTGIMHYAASMNVPLVALHGATSELRWGPLSDNAIVVKSGEDCQPCISLGAETKCCEPRCMQNITVSMVANAVQRLLNVKI